MDENRFISTFDKIKCSREFYIRMREQLSESGGSGEYTDTVSHVDVAVPHTRRYAALGTAACIAVCAAGFGVWKLSDRRSADKSNVETDDAERIDNPVIMPASTEPVTIQPPSSEKDNLVKEGEMSELLADAIEGIKTGEIRTLYDQSPETGDNSYEVGYTADELNGWLERLRQIYWTKKTITTEEFHEYYNHITIIGGLYFTSEGVVCQNSGSYELYSPEKVSSKTVYENTLKKLAVRRYQNVEEFLTNYKELSPSMTADIEFNVLFMGKNFGPSAEFAGHYIAYYKDFDYNTSGKVYFDSESGRCFADVSGTESSEDDLQTEIEIGCVSHGERTDYILLGNPDEMVYLPFTSSYLRDVDGVSRSMYYNIYRNDESFRDDPDFILNPGDYFVLKNDIIRNYRKFIKKLSVTELDINDELVVETTTDENGELIINVIMYYDGEKDILTHDSAICFSMNEMGFITEYRCYESGRLKAECRLTNINYEEFEMPQRYDVFAELTADMQFGG